MSNQINYHKSKNKKRVDRRYPEKDYDNGYPTPNSFSEFIARDGTIYKTGKRREHGYLDKSMHSWSNTSKFADVIVGASIGNDFANGHRGMARAVAGAKKFIRRRIRFHEKAKLNQMILVDID